MVPVDTAMGIIGVRVNKILEVIYEMSIDRHRQNSTPTDLQVSINKENDPLSYNHIWDPLISTIDATISMAMVVNYLQYWRDLKATYRLMV
jgi:hypothetical protein